MTRKVTEQAVKTPDLQIKAQMNDTYTRPAPAPETELEQLAGSLVNIQPSLSKYLQTKKEEKQDFEIAQGMEIYNKLLATGQDLPAEEVNKKIAAGDLTGFSQLSKWKKQGYYQARHQRTGLQLQTHMLTWSEGATLDDGNGNQVPLAQIHDQDRVLTAFMQEQSRYVNEQTGGKYDPVFYRKYIQSAANLSANTFINQQAKARVQQMEIEQVKASTGILDGIVMPYIRDGSLQKNPDTAIPQLTEALQLATVDMRQRGMDEKDATATLTEYLQSAMRNLPSDNIETILKVAEGLSLWSNPEVRTTLQQAATRAESDAYFKNERDKQARQDKAETEIFDLLRPMLNGSGVDRNAVEAFTQRSPEHLKAFNEIHRAISIGFENQNAMDEEAYNDLYISLLSGKKSYNEVLRYAGSMNKEQVTDLLQVAEHNEMRVKRFMAERQSATRRSASDSVVKKPYDAIAKELKKYYNPDDLIKLAGSGTQKYNIGKVTKNMQTEAYINFMAWSESNPNASFVQKDAMRSKLVYETFRKYEPNLSTYEDNPDKMSQNPKQVSVETDSKAVAKFRNSLKPKAQQEFYKKAIGDTKEFSKWLRQQGIPQSDQKAKRLQEQLNNMK